MNNNNLDPINQKKKKKSLIWIFFFFGKEKQQYRFESNNLINMSLLWTPYPIYPKSHDSLKMSCDYKYTHIVFLTSTYVVGSIKIHAT